VSPIIQDSVLEKHGANGHFWLKTLIFFGFSSVLGLFIPKNAAFERRFGPVSREICVPFSWVDDCG
jgi:hypothetical protein